MAPRATTATTTATRAMNLVDRARERVVPTLTRASAYKGSHGGKFVILGGSKVYVGAPYFAAAGAMRAGGDLVHVVTHAACAQTIKSYAPDVIVHAGWAQDATTTTTGTPTTSDVVDGVLDIVRRYRIDAAVVGPGLDDGAGLECVEAMTRTLGTCVVDADALKTLTPERETTTTRDGGDAPLATPNKMELWRLVQKVRPDAFPDGVTTMDLREEAHRTRVARALREYRRFDFLVKGDDDYLFVPRRDEDDPAVFAAVVDRLNADPTTETDDEDAGEDDAARGVCASTTEDGVLVVRLPCVGAPKRSGGQGDVLAGVLAVFLFWCRRTPLAVDRTPADALLDRVAAVAAACRLVKRAARDAYADLGRGLIAADVIDRIPRAFMRELEDPR